MKITSVEPFVVDIGPRNWLFVVVETDEGVSGIGEGSLPAHPRAVAAAVEEYREYIVGEDPARIQHLWQLMYRRPFFRGGEVDDVIQQHQTILDAVRAHNPKAAAQTMRDHLQQTEQDLRTLLG